VNACWLAKKRTQLTRTVAHFNLTLLGLELCTKPGDGGLALGQRSQFLGSINSGSIFDVMTADSMISVAPVRANQSSLKAQEKIVSMGISVGALLSSSGSVVIKMSTSTPLNLADAPDNCVALSPAQLLMVESTR